MAEATSREEIKAKIEAGKADFEKTMKRPPNMIEVAIIELLVAGSVITNLEPPSKEVN